MRKVMMAIVVLMVVLFLAGCIGPGKAGGNVTILSITQDHTKLGSPWRVSFTNKGNSAAQIRLVLVDAYDKDGNKLASDSPIPNGVVTKCDHANVCTRTLGAGQTAHVHAFSNLSGVHEIGVFIAWGEFQLTKGTFKVPFPN